MTACKESTRTFAPDIARIARAWSGRAQVRSYDALEPVALDPQAPDFLEDLLPFSHLSSFQALDVNAKSRVHSIGWVLYNQKTIQIESEIIVPTCSEVLQHMPSHIDDGTAYAISQTMTDEAFHTYLSVLNIRLNCAFRDLTIASPQFELISNLKSLPAASRRLDLLAVATVSELFISDYLRKVSEAQHIQPLHRQSVNAHRLDEGVHAHVFAALLPQVLSDMDRLQAERFATMLVEGAAWFASNECLAWQHALTRDGEARFSSLLDELSAVPSSSVSHHDFSKVGEVALEHGLVSEGQFLELVSAAQDRARSSSAQTRLESIECTAARACSGADRMPADMFAIEHGSAVSRQCKLWSKPLVR